MSIKSKLPSVRLVAWCTLFPQCVLIVFCKSQELFRGLLCTCAQEENSVWTLIGRNLHHKSGTVYNCPPCIFNCRSRKVIWTNQTTLVGATIWNKNGVIVFVNNCSVLLSCRPTYLMKPLPSLSKTLKASLISSSESVSFILRAIIVKNSGKSIVPLPKEKNEKRRTMKWGFWVTKLGNILRCNKN